MTEAVIVTFLCGPIQIRIYTFIQGFNEYIFEEPKEEGLAIRDPGEYFARIQENRRRRQKGRKR